MLLVELLEICDQRQFDETRQRHRLIDGGVLHAADQELRQIDVELLLFPVFVDAAILAS
jgi:hypothetical protein